MVTRCWRSPTNKKGCRGIEANNLGIRPQASEPPIRSSSQEASDTGPGNARRDAVHSLDVQGGVERAIGFAIRSGVPIVAVGEHHLVAVAAMEASEDSRVNRATVAGHRFRCGGPGPKQPSSLVTKRLRPHGHFSIKWQSCKSRAPECGPEDGTMSPVKQSGAFQQFGLRYWWFSRNHLNGSRLDKLYCGFLTRH